MTSGYGSAIEEVDATTGRVLRRAAAPYGSFELDAAEVVRDFIHRQDEIAHDHWGSRPRGRAPFSA